MVKNEKATLTNEKYAETLNIPISRCKRCIDILGPRRMAKESVLCYDCSIRLDELKADIEFLKSNNI